MTGTPWRAAGLAAWIVVALAPGVSAQLVRCESIGGQRQVCGATTTHGVALARQLGGSSCVAGKTWGWDPGAIWVEENCRGEFRTVYEERPGQVIVTCDSDHNRVERCPADTQYGVILIAADSSDSCQQGTGWGWDQGSVWVDKRCSADFVLAGPELGRSVRCEAPADAPAGTRYLCAVDTRGGVTLLAEHRPGPCEFGKNWGLAAEGIWFERECAGTFVVDGRLRGSPYWSQPARFVCGSPLAESDFCPVDTAEGVRAVATDVCIQGQTWDWTAQGIWVAGGCSGEFVLGR